MKKFTLPVKLLFRHLHLTFRNGSCKCIYLNKLGYSEMN